MSSIRIKISEVFSSIQGEGPSVGRPSTFVRLALCNLRCTWCDTPYTWDWERFDPKAEISVRDVDELAGEVRGLVPRNVVITGGEPLMQQAPLEALTAALDGFRFEVETAGTQVPSQALIDRIDQWNVSPKLAHSGNPLDRRRVPEALARFAALPGATFKVVVRGEADLDEVSELCADFSIAPERVWLMPEATDAETLIARSLELADLAVARGMNLGTRLQVLLWGDTRGT